MNGTETTKIFADRLTDLISEECQKEGITLEELGERIGVGRSSLSKYQNDNGEPGINSAVKIARYFGVTLDYLCGIEDCKTHENSKINGVLGLSDSAISTLRYHVPHANNPTERLYFDTLNHIIEDLPLIASIGDYIFEKQTGELGHQVGRIKELFEAIDVDGAFTISEEGVSPLGSYRYSKEDMHIGHEIVSEINMIRVKKYLAKARDIYKVCRYKEAHNADQEN